MPIVVEPTYASPEQASEETGKHHCLIWLAGAVNVSISAPDVSGSQPRGSAAWRQQALKRTANHGGRPALVIDGCSCGLEWHCWTTATSLYIILFEPREFLQKYFAEQTLLMITALLRKPLALALLPDNHFTFFVLRSPTRRRLPRFTFTVRNRKPFKQIGHSASQPYIPYSAEKQRVKSVHKIVFSGEHVRIVDNTFRLKSHLRFSRTFITSGVLLVGFQIVCASAIFSALLLGLATLRSLQLP